LEGEIITVTPTSGNCVWTAIASEPWIDIADPPSGTGSGNVIYTVDPNPNCVSRMGTIFIGGQTYTITQAAGNGYYGLSQPSATIPGTGGSGAVPLEAGTECLWTATTPDSSWISLIAPTSGTGTNMIRFTVAANPNCEPRTGTITVAGLTYTVA
jgi:hypothetical protein